MSSNMDKSKMQRITESVQAALNAITKSLVCTTHSHFQGHVTEDQYIDTLVPHVDRILTASMTAMRRRVVTQWHMADPKSALAVGVWGAIKFDFEIYDVDGATVWTITRRGASREGIAHTYSVRRGQFNIVINFNNKGFLLGITKCKGATL